MDTSFELTLFTFSHIYIHVSYVYFRLQFPPFWGVKTKVLSLPVGLTCSQCVLQWKYVTGKTFINTVVAVYTYNGIVRNMKIDHLFTR